MEQGRVEELQEELAVEGEQAAAIQEEHDALDDEVDDLEGGELEVRID